MFCQVEKDLKSLIIDIIFSFVMLWSLLHTSHDCSYILENAHNLRSSSTRVTKELAKSLFKKESDLSNYHQKFAIIYHMSKTLF